MAACSPAAASGSEAGPEGNPGEKNEPVSEKENALDDADCHGWPGFQAGSPSFHDCMSRGKVAHFEKRTRCRTVVRVQQSFHEELRRQRAGSLHLDSVLPVEVHVLQLRVGSVSGFGSRTLCRARDCGSGRRAGVGQERWERISRGAWIRFTWAEERRRCWRRSC